MATGDSPDFSDFDPVATPDPFGGASAAPDAGAQGVITPASTAPQAKDPQPQPKPPKPGWNVYVFMLMMCIAFLAVGCVLLVTELRRYNFEIQPGKPLF